MAVPRPFLAALLALCALYLALAIPRASRTSLRGDEAVTLEANWRGQSWGDLLLHGARSQVSASPLSYLIDKAWDASRRRLGWLGLTPTGYIRLPSILFTVALGFAAALAVARRVPRGQGAWPYAVVISALAAFYFHPKAFLLSYTERPYAIWNGLWLLLLAWLLGRPPATRGPLVLASLLALSASASCFQILALGIALLGVRLLERRAPIDLLREGAALLALPAALAAFYALQGDGGADPGDTESRFWRLWIRGHLEVWVAVAATLALLRRRPALREFALPVAAVAALLLLAPLMAALAGFRGVPFASRQYLWTSSALPLLFFFCAVGWDRLPRGRRLLAVLAAGVAIASFAVAAGRGPVKKDSRSLRLLEASSPLMQGPRPASLQHAPDLGPTERTNLALIAEWISAKHAGRPASSRSVAVVERDGELIAEDSDLREGWIRIAVP